MKIVLLTAFLVLPCTAHASQVGQEIIEVLSPMEQYPKNSSIVEHHTNLRQIIDGKFILERTKLYPTHVVRMTADVEKLQRKCEEVLAEIHSFYSAKLDSEKFFYNTIIYCGYDPKTDLATRFSIFSFFDPLDDGAIEYAKTFVSSISGADLLGTPFSIESANSLVVSLNVDAGMSQDAYASVLLRVQHDNENLYFPSNYEMIKELITDTYERFYSNDPKIVLPYFAKWFGYHAGSSYYRALTRSDYVLLQPERIFMMSKAPHVFTSPLRMYYGHKCEKYTNKRCL